MTSESHRIAAPALPAAPQPYSFPVMATIAPVVVSLAIWFITSSPFALVFAALGPAVAVASLADARIQSRRRRRRESARFRAELAAAQSEVAAAHDRERADLVAGSPSARRLVLSTWSEPERWLGGLADPVEVCIGAGRRASVVALDGAPTTTRSRDGTHTQLRALVEAAARLDDAPLLVDARLGIGVVGARVIAESAARGLLLQLLASLSPADHGVVVQTDDAEQWAWLERLPHSATILAGASPSRTVIRVRSTAPPPVGADPRDAEVLVAVAARTEQLPPAARIVVETDGLRATVVHHPDRALLGPLRLERVSREEAVAVARGMVAHAARAGFGESVLPDSVAFSDCGPRAQTREGRAPGSLAAVVAVTAHAPLELDLVAQGPHAIVGGTTGSGKSELLTAWILAIADDHSPDEATVLLVDFKGGSAFASLEGLPHCVGMITDLDEAGARRALLSLAAELRRRERVLAGAGAKSIDVLPTGVVLPRLVIVVDEFAAMVSGFPDLHAVFADIAARGRSLGVHLVLCTQRPAGVIRDSVLANSTLRVSLRVNNRADSAAVIGSDAAANLPLNPRGRAFVMADGARPQLAQFPLVTQADIDRVAARWATDGRHAGHITPGPHQAGSPRSGPPRSGSPRSGQRRSAPHRPWLDPLPSVLALDAVRAGDHDGIPFGLLDDPANQAQPAAVYRPDEHGNLLVVGAASSGKSTLLATLAASAAVQRVPAGIEAAWDALVSLAAEISTADPGTAYPTAADPAADPAAADPGTAPTARPRLVLLDDVDALLARFPEEYESAATELVTRCLREGPALGIHWVVTAQRLTPALHPVVGLCGSRLLLRLPSRQEHVLAGGDGGDFEQRLPPGAGRWNGLRVQIAVPPTPAGAVTAAIAAHPPRVVDGSVPLAIVSSRPAEFAARLARALPGFARPGAIVDVGGAPAPTATRAPVDPAGLAVSRAAATAAATTAAATTAAAIIGDVDAWQSQWGALAAARSSHLVVVDGCTASEFRALTRIRALPPVLDGSRGGAFWLIDRAGTVTRATLPDH